MHNKGFEWGLVDLTQNLHKTIKSEFLGGKLKHSELLEGKGEKISKKRMLQWCQIDPHWRISSKYMQ